jgi:hypothetical protein
MPLTEAIPGLLLLGFFAMMLILFFACCIALGRIWMYSKQQVQLLQQIHRLLRDGSPAVEQAPPPVIRPRR